MLNGRADDPQPKLAGRPDEPVGSDSRDDQGLSLERLSQAFARAMEGHHDAQPPDRTTEVRSTEDRPTGELRTDEVGALEGLSPRRGRPDAVELDLPLAALPGARIDREVDARCPISPRSIAEAILFVGHPENQPLTSRLMAALMRGVSPAEVDQIVDELNAGYRAEQAPYEIAVVPGGFLLQLLPEHSRLRNKLHGRVRETRLSQAAIEVLALVAYNQPVGRARIDQLRGKPSGALLSQLVRRDLLGVARSTDRPRELLYRTSERFLDIFGLDSLDDLPQADGPGSLEP